MRSLRTLILLGLALSALVSGQGSVYIRNKPVPARLRVSLEELNKFFTPQELERCQFDPKSGQILVDGRPLAEGLGAEPDGVPVTLLAEALGFKKRVNPALGVVDYVAPATLEGRRPTADAPKRQGTEYRVAASRMEKITRKYPSVTNHPEYQRVQSIGQKIAQNSDMPGQEWKFLIVADPDPNAFCTGVGWVAVSEGLLRLKLTDDELAGVLGHEVGHGCKRDLEERSYNADTSDRLATEVRGLYAKLEALERQQALYEAEARRTSELARQMTTAAMINQLRAESSEAARQAEDLERPIRNTRREIENKEKLRDTHQSFAKDSSIRHQDEREADIKGLYYTSRAGYAPEGLLSALQKLANRDYREFGQAAYQGGTNHPPLKSRIETMRKVLADWRKG